MPIYNLKNLNSEEKNFLNEFFDAQARLGIQAWSKNKDYVYDGQTIRFKNDVYRRERKNGKDDVRYEIISNKATIASGTFGEVKALKGTLTLDEDHYRFKKNTKDGGRRVVKIQQHSSRSNPLDSLTNEYTTSLAAGHLSIKKPTIEEVNWSSSKSYTTMKRIPGRELFNIIADDMRGIIVLTYQQRIDLTKMLLNALKVQVTDKGIIHRDIKPENILVDLGPPIAVNIIDFGLSDKVGSVEDLTKGTYNYLAPESITAPATINTKADVYSMARVIAQLWSVDSDSYNPDHRLRIFTPEECLLNLGDNVDGMTNKDKNILTKTLSKMLSIDVTNRYSIDQSIKEFARLGLGNRLEKNSLFSPVSHVKRTINPVSNIQNSCFTTDQLLAINQLIGKLESEINSFWPYPNKDLKQAKVDGLNDLINKSRTLTDPTQVLLALEMGHRNIRHGLFSRRTADLLDSLWQECATTLTASV